VSGTKQYCPKLKSILGKSILLEPFDSDSNPVWHEDGGNAYALVCHPLVKKKAIHY
jgi:hypothetical protein